ncbi:DNA polymerase III subunit beta [Bartonella apihabitans]|nr:DNA polymerase III subunit beta [Bartonella apihabitans]WLT09622.1 DNA polymerase III subunit beta [Bartonella apihabitans]
MINLKREELLPALATFKKITSPRNNEMEILNNVILEADGNKLKLFGTDLNIQATVTLCCNGDGNIVTTANARALEKIVRAMPKKSIIYFNDNSTSLSVKDREKTFSIPTLSAKNMPASDNTKVWQWTFTIGGDELERINKKLFSSISTDEFRYYLNGVCWCVDQEQPEKLISVATDGARLACLATDVGASIANLPPIIIPRQFWQLAKGFFNVNEQVIISISENKIRARQGQKEIISKLIDGTYPDFKVIVPQNNMKFGLKRTDLIAAIKNVSTVFTQKKYMPINFSFEKKILLLSADNKAEGKISTEVNVTHSNASNAIETGFDGKLLLEILNACEADEVIFALDPKSPRGAAIIKEDGDNDVYYLLMPLRN